MSAISRPRNGGCRNRGRKMAMTKRMLFMSIIGSGLAAMGVLDDHLIPVVIGCALMILAELEAIRAALTREDT